MTEGNPKLLVRVPPELLQEICEIIARRNQRTREEPWDVSKFIRCAIRDKLHHMQRSRRSHRRKRKATQGTATPEV